MWSSHFTVLLSASVPSGSRSKKYQEQYTKITNAQVQIEEAVIGLSRNVFQAGGKMVFGGHPSISPLVAMVAMEFRLGKDNRSPEGDEQSEKPITIFQSRAFENVIPKETTSLLYMGYSEITWTDAINGEQFNPKIQNTTQCEKSLAFMRREMMKGNLDGLVCIGGMEGIEREFELFRELHPSKPAFILRSTGGASKILADRFSKTNFVRVIDSEDILSAKRSSAVGLQQPEPFDIIPYSFLTALIVKEILDGKRG